MATKPLFRLSRESQESLRLYLASILADHRKFTELTNKMEAIDIAYARYKAAKESDTNGVDIREAETDCGVGLNDITVPVVISQVDSYVGYLADVFLTGYPIFPVVSSPKDRKLAEKLEAIIGDHSLLLGGYARELLLSFRDGMKYDFMPMAIEWEPIDQYSVASSVIKPLEQSRAVKSTSYYNKLRRVDPYNTIWDKHCAPAEVSFRGDFVGEVSIISRIELKKLLAIYSSVGNGYNISRIFSIDATKDSGGDVNYRDAPQISNLVTRQPLRNQTAGSTDWIAWLNSQRINQQAYRDCYEKICLYARIIPSEHKIFDVPEPNTPQIWKLVFINGNVLIHARRVITAFDMLPIYIAQPLEDGFSYQTQSLAESEMPIQDASSTLFNIRLNSARRAVADRAIFNPDLILSSHVNAKHASPKIPLRPSATLGAEAIKWAYHQIPFDDSGTAGTIADASRVIELSSMMRGVNRPQQGQFQKGNKSVREWEDTMAGSNNRLRLPALAIEQQAMGPIREQIKVNIFQYGVDGVFQNRKTGESYEINNNVLEEIRKAIMSYRTGDGYTPKSKLASTEFLLQGMNMIAQSQYLQERWGPALPEMFAHLMQLGGVAGLEEYLPPQGDPNVPGAIPQSGSGNPGTPRV